MGNCQKNKNGAISLQLVEANSWVRYHRGRLNREIRKRNKRAVSFQGDCVLFPLRGDIRGRTLWEK